MADTNSTATPIELEYNHQPWGELIYGTMEQLQAIGLGVGVSFPDGPRKKIKMDDPRGFPVEISSEKWKGDGIFCASIRFPGRSTPEEKWAPFAFGVRKMEHTWFDEYIGTAEALVTAGIVPPGHFPGWPGMRKATVTILPDGTLPTGAPTANCRQAKEPGAKCVTRASRGKTATYSVNVRISDEEGEKRLQAYHEEQDAWRRRMAALPRPRPLYGSSPTQSSEHRTQSVAEFRTSCRRWLDLASTLIYEGVEENGFVLLLALTENCPT